MIGILPGLDATDANPFVDIALPTGLGLARNVLVVASADAVIAIGGRSGTLSEIALAWQLGRPVIAIDGHGGWAAELAGRAVDDRRTDTVRAVSSVAEAVRAVADVL